MLISHSHQFIFFHVAKTGGMSARAVLEPFAEEPEKFKIKRPPRIKNGKPNKVYEMWEAILLHAKARDAKKLLPNGIFDDYYKFAFVRNPWAWQVSMYHFILKEPKHVKRKLVESMSGFDEYLEWVIATPNPYPKGATKLQAEAIADADGNLLVDYVGRFETLADDFNAVCGQLNLDVRLPHRNKSKHRDYRDYYNDHTRALVAKHFQQDIELFGYTFDIGS